MSTLAMNQSYFFPYVGYFSLIDASDLFIIADHLQYIKKGWINRNRILKPSGNDWQYLGIPIQKAPQKTPINKVLTRDNTWKNKILAQLQHYKTKAPYYSEVVDFLHDCFLFDSNELSKINVHFLQKTCDFLEIEFTHKYYSDIEIKHPTVNQSDEWGLNTAIGLGYNKYINLPGGVNFFDIEKYNKNKIEIKFIKPDLSNYRTNQNETFFPALSILDMLLYAGRDKTKEIIKNYTLKG